jgi:hypothetical protein
MTVWIRYETYLNLNAKRTIKVYNDHDLHEYGMEYVHRFLTKKGDYSKGLMYICNVIDKPLFMLAVIKHGVEFFEPNKDDLSVI